jgi:hypothetical protein
LFHTGASRTQARYIVAVLNTEHKVSATCATWDIRASDTGVDRSAWEVGNRGGPPKFTVELVLVKRSGDDGLTVCSRGYDREEP